MVGSMLKRTLLSGATNGRENNFNLIRIVAALAVLVSHSYQVARGRNTPDMLGATLGMSLGEIAVDVFFITSGFLVTSSLVSRQNTAEFLWARFLRIFPGLWVMLLFAVFLLGPAFSSLPTADYFAAKSIYGYLAKCGTLIAGVGYELPGVFDGNPLPHAVNGSLWTMPYELKMYLLLAIVWLALWIAKDNRRKLFNSVIVTLATASAVFVIADHFWLHASRQFAHFFYVFFIGAGAFILRDRVALSWPTFSAFAIALAASALNKDVFFVVYTCLLPYLVLFLAYAPSGLVLAYNKLGDYSYGVYIYAFPVQQAIAATAPGISVLQLVATAAAVTLLFAVASWHLVESHALALKKLAKPRSVPMQPA
jgi:peptidoglycan/LPS O-acetylase OafA/YrhL